jgi:hypothetical protein
MQARTWGVSDLIARLEPDPWRSDHPFSDDIVACHKLLFHPETSRDDKAAAVARWLGESQPCLFGRMEAKRNALAFCILTENDLERSDQEIRKTIQQERREWKRRALSGDSHAFLIVAISESIAHARRGPMLRDVATRLCELYLDEVAIDEIHHDDLMLKIERDGDEMEWRHWKVGVNYFSAQGDGLWWHDHRLPGGMAFSMNSVGHMARWRAERALKKDPKRVPADVPRERLVYWALPTAMNTIGPPIEGSHRGTWLAERGTFPEDREPPTYAERQRYFGDLAGYSENRYKGRYHTDHTIPTRYFEEGLWELEKIAERDDLYFTYLHSRSDSDYDSMGIGKLFDVDDEGSAMNQVEDGSEQ